MHFKIENLDSIRVDKEFEISLRSMIAQDESNIRTLCNFFIFHFDFFKN